MPQSLSKWLSSRERVLRRTIMGNRDTLWGRVMANLDYYILDHAILRVFWTNFYEVAPGVCRSNQPTHARFRRYRDQGIRAVINLRGEEEYPHFQFAKESCESLGLELHIAKLWARNAPKRIRIEAVIDTLRTVEGPFLFHCKSGADRAGFVAAMYEMIFAGKSVQEARKMLSLRFVHLKWTKTGVQDYILDVYEARLAEGPIGFEDWIRTEYAATPIQQGWDGRKPAAEVSDILVARRKAQDAANG